MNDVAAAVGVGTPSDQMSLLVRLRTGTAECHQRIEQNPRMRELMSPQLTLAGYGDLLLRQWEFHAALEPVLFRILDTAATPWTPAPESRLEWLRSDLQTLGLAEPPFIGAETIGIPPLASLAAAVGALYLLEGSTLGGRLISKHLSQHLQLSPEQGMRFYHGYGDVTGAHWAKFRASLDQLHWSIPQSEEAVATAVALFEALDRWLQPEVTKV